MTTKITFKHQGKTIIKEDKRNIFECLRALIKWRDENKNKL